MNPWKRRDSLMEFNNHYECTALPEGDEFGTIRLGLKWVVYVQGCMQNREQQSEWADLLSTDIVQLLVFITSSLNTSVFNSCFTTQYVERNGRVFFSRLTLIYMSLEEKASAYKLPISRMRTKIQTCNVAPKRSPAVNEGLSGDMWNISTFGVFSVTFASDLYFSHFFSDRKRSSSHPERMGKEWPGHELPISHLFDG